MISVLILTLNEETNLPRCLEAVRWSDDIVVFDSGSSDRTVEIARAAGARVVTRPFDNERDHRTASLAVGFKYPWVFNPDADEVPEPELVVEMQRIVADPARTEVAYRVRFRNLFFGKWIRFSSLYPTWIVRLFRPDRLRFERTINLRYCCDGPEGRLEGHLRHYSFNKGLHSWFEKHNKYSTAEAEEAFALAKSGQGVRWRDLLAGGSVERRRALKELSFRMPFRPTLRFWYMYLVRLGFLDGAAGLMYCRLLAMYEAMMVYKMKELRRRERGLPV